MGRKQQHSDKTDRTGIAHSCLKDVRPYEYANPSLAYTEKYSLINHQQWTLLMTHWLPLETETGVCVSLLQPTLIQTIGHSLFVLE